MMTYHNVFLSQMADIITYPGASLKLLQCSGLLRKLTPPHYELEVSGPFN